MPGTNGTIIFDSGIDNRIGAWLSASAPVPAGSKQAVVTATLPASELTDPTNTMRLGIEADFGLGFRHMAWGATWTGAPGNATPPAVQWGFAAASPPLRVRAVIETITQVVVTSVAVAFA
jgi:hypothetical protein